jgi:hypothetical protein
MSLALLVFFFAYGHVEVLSVTAFESRPEALEGSPTHGT